MNDIERLDQSSRAMNTLCKSLRKEIAFLRKENEKLKISLSSVNEENMNAERETNKLLTDRVLYLEGMLSIRTK